MSSRRGHGEGSIFQRAGDGKWLAVLEIGRDPATGKRARRTITTATRREAAQRLRAMRDQLDRGAINVDGRATIGQWSDDAAIHMVALGQLSHPSTGRDYDDRKLAEGKTHREALRALKRQLADVIWRHPGRRRRRPRHRPMNRPGRTVSTNG